MGFFDRLAAKKAVQPVATPAAPEGAHSSKTRLEAARAKLDAEDLPGAMAIYEEVLATAGDRPDVLVTISADLGITGHLPEIIELVAPRYDAERHGPATGINLLQAYLALRQPEAAQHVLDILFALNRPDLEQRLYGFSNALAELINSPDLPPLDGGPAPAAIPTVSLISISKPIWYYGLEAIDGLLPAKSDKLRRIAFTQLAQPELKNVVEAMSRPEDELGRFSRGLPLWFAEAFYASSHYKPIAAIGLMPKNYYAIFGSEWTPDNLRQLVASCEGGLDYILTGAIRPVSGGHELILRLWEVKKLRERKQFTARWTPATADAELAKLHEQVRLFMEWNQDNTGVPYAAPASPLAWIDTLGLSQSLFLAGKDLLPPEQLSLAAPVIAAAQQAAATDERAALAWLTLTQRAKATGQAWPAEAVALKSSPLVEQAQAVIG